MKGPNTKMFCREFEEVSVVLFIFSADIHTFYSSPGAG